jgi:hypothetical protein
MGSLIHRQLSSRLFRQVQSTAKNWAYFIARRRLTFPTPAEHRQKRALSFSCRGAFPTAVEHR